MQDLAEEQPLPGVLAGSHAVELRPGGGSETPEPDAEAQAAIFVAKGTLRLIFGGQSHDLTPGTFALALFQRLQNNFCAVDHRLRQASQACNLHAIAAVSGAAAADRAARRSAICRADRAKRGVRGSGVSARHPALAFNCARGRAGVAGRSSTLWQAEHFSE